jgi:hypothetical protein
MSNQNDLPATAEEAIARGFVLRPDINAFIREHLNITPEEHEHRWAELSLQVPSVGVDCAAAPENTPCFRQCLPNGTLILGFCTKDNNCTRYSKENACTPW